MWTETGHLAWTWCRITLALTLTCGLTLAIYGLDSTVFTIVVVVAGLLELATIRALAREWSFHASGCWWWPR